MHPACDIIIVSYNQREYTHACIESIYRNTQQPFRIIVVDNASDVPTRQYLAQEHTAERILLVQNEHNAGWVGGVNDGLHRSNAAFVCIMNNDTVVYPGWLSEMIAVAQSDSRIGIVNPLWRVPKRYPFGRNRYITYHVYPRRGTYIQSDWARGFCFLVKRAVIDRIGGLDTAYAPGFYDDWDFSMRAAQAGFICVLSLGAFVWHHVSVSFRPAVRTPGIKAMLAAKGRIFYRTWGFPQHILVILKRHELPANINYTVLLGDVLRKQARIVAVVRDALSTRHTNYTQFSGPMVFTKSLCVIFDNLRHSKAKRFDFILCSAKTRDTLKRLIPVVSGYRFLIFDECVDRKVFSAQISESMKEKAELLIFPRKSRHN